MIDNMDMSNTTTNTLPQIGHVVSFVPTGKSTRITLKVTEAAFMSQGGIHISGYRQGSSRTQSGGRYGFMLAIDTPIKHVRNY